MAEAPSTIVILAPAPKGKKATARPAFLPLETRSLKPDTVIGIYRARLTKSFPNVTHHHQGKDSCPCRGRYILNIVMVRIISDTVRTKDQNLEIALSNEIAKNLQHSFPTTSSSIFASANFGYRINNGKPVDIYEILSQCKESANKDQLASRS